MRLQVNLFRRFQAYQGNIPLECFNTTRVQELFCYLLLNRRRPHRREALIEILWGEDTPRQAKKYLRQLLWQLRSALPEEDPAGDPCLLTVDEEWIRICPQANLALDVHEFEQAFRLTRDVDGAELHPTQAEALQKGVQLYAGDLLEGWYQDWCVFERERLQNIYLMVLDKLMAYAEAHGQYEAGVQYGVRALRCDRAHEITYQRLMRLRYLAGDRSGALRYYARCVEALLEELDVEPTARTKALYMEICADRALPASGRKTPNAAHEAQEQSRPENLNDLLDSCMILNQTLKTAQAYNEQNIRLLAAKLSAQSQSIAE